MKSLRIGYVPLADAALLIVARDKGFAARRGLDLELVAEASWANIRDRLLLGYFDAAHMLAPAAIATTLGVGRLQARLVAPVALGLNGNALTVSMALHAELKVAADGDLADPLVSARALARVVAARRGRGVPAPTFGFVFPFSSHHYQLRLWMRAGGVDPDKDVRLVVLPPPLMTKGLATGYLEGFCVGEPWNSQAVIEGVGDILHLGVELVRDCPEKVLALRADWARAHPEATSALSNSVLDASRWCADPGNLDEFSRLLAFNFELNLSPEMMRAIIAGVVKVDSAGATRANPAYLRLDPPAIMPRARDAQWLFTQMVGAGQATDTPENVGAAVAVYQPDACLAGIGAADDAGTSGLSR